MQLCIGTSLAIMVPTSLRSYLAHRSKEAVIPDIVLMWSLSAVVGVAGSLVAVGAPAVLFFGRPALHASPASVVSRISCL